jgi:hypothetical protein
MPQAVLVVASQNAVMGWREGRAQRREEKGRRKKVGGAHRGWAFQVLV